MITGTGYDGTLYSAVQAFLLNSTSHVNVSQELHIYANELVCGTRLGSRADRVFTSMVLSSPALTQWAIPRRIKRLKQENGIWILVYASEGEDNPVGSTWLGFHHVGS